MPTTFRLGKITCATTQRSWKGAHEGVRIPHLLSVSLVRLHSPVLFLPLISPLWRFLLGFDQRRKVLEMMSWVSELRFSSFEVV